MDKVEVMIPFNRRALWGMFRLAAVISLCGVALVTLFAGCVLFDVPHVPPWQRATCVIFLTLFCLCYLFAFQWAMFLGRCLRHHLPAIVLRQDGLVDNASGYWAGLLPWSELARIHPVGMTRGLRFGSRLVFCLRRERVVLISLKDTGWFRSHLSWLKAISFSLEQPKRTLKVGGTMLATTPEEFMRQLNEYYITHVRRDGLP
jgi:hypothetical protein